MDEFWSLIEASQGDNIPVSRNWDLSNWTISIDDESAHVSYKNDGTFVTSINGEEITTNPIWLGAYLVLDDDELKLNFSLRKYRTIYQTEYQKKYLYSLRFQST